MSPDSVVRASVKKKPSSIGSNLVKLTTLGILGLGVILANGVSVPAPNSAHTSKDIVAVFAGSELSANCANSGCIKVIAGATKDGTLFASGAGIRVGQLNKFAVCEMTSSGVIKGTGCTIDSGVSIPGAGLSLVNADARYVNTSGDTMTGTLITRSVTASGVLTVTRKVGTGTGNMVIVDSKGLVYDGTNKRVGIGTSAPKTALEVVGTASSSLLTVSGLSSCTNVQTSAIGVTSCNSAVYLIASTQTVVGVGQGLSLNSGLLTLAATHSGTTISAQTLSGKTLIVKGNVFASGSLTVEGVPRMQRVLTLPICDAVTACATGSGIVYRIPLMMSGTTLTAVTLDAGIPGTTSTMTVQVINKTKNYNLLSTDVSLDSAEPSSDTAATPAVINTKTFANGDILIVRVDTVHTTPAKGVSINLTLSPP